MNDFVKLTCQSVFVRSQGDRHLGCSKRGAKVVALIGTTSALVHGLDICKYVESELILTKAPVLFQLCLWVKRLVTSTVKDTSVVSKVYVMASVDKFN